MSGDMSFPISTRYLEKLPHRFQVMFALFCARQVEEYWKHTPEAINCIEIVERWLDGKASEEECKKAAYTAAKIASTTYATYAVYTVVYTAAYTVYTAAAYAADAATTVAHDATHISKNREEAIKAQWEYYYELLHFDENVERILLGGEL